MRGFPGWGPGIVVACIALACSEPKVRYVSTEAPDAGKRAAPGTRMSAGSAADASTEAQPDAAVATLEPNGDAMRFAIDITHACMIRSGDTLWCWGSNSAGEISGKPSAPLLPAQITKKTDWALLGLGAWHSCALKTDQSLWCWGDNRGGEIGNGSEDDDVPMVQIGKDRWISIAGGQSHTCGVKADGSLWCWGRNDSGQLGETSTDMQKCAHAISLPSTLNYFPCMREPLRVGSDDDWQSVTAGGLRACALKTNGTLWCWGARDGLSEKTTVPTQVGTDSDWVSAAIDSDIGCGLKADMSVACWLPVKKVFTGLRFQSVSVSQSAGCGLTTDGRALCWGDASDGMRGNNPIDSQGITEIAPDLRWTEVVAGGFNGCGQTDAGSVLCWGSNYHHVLGDGKDSHDMAACISRDCSYEPVEAAFPSGK